jgi:transposase-like protein
MRKLVLNFVQMIPSLDHDEEQLIKNAFAGVSDRQKVRELIEAPQEQKRACPHCESNHVYRHGKSDGLQRYRCVGCGKTYNALTNTPLARLRKKELWLHHLNLMLQSCVLRDVSKEMNISLTTAFRWRHRFSTWLEQDIPEHLEGIVEMDETYFKHSKKGDKTIGRAPHKRGGPASQRGLSKEQVCIFTAQDRSKHCIEAIAGVGPVSGAWLTGEIAPLIAIDSVIVSDGLASYQKLVREEKLDHVVVKNRRGQRAKGAYHIQHVNAYHSRLKQWINGHFHGVATKYLNHYLWWKHEIENKHIQSATDLFKAATHQIPQLETT